MSDIFMGGMIGMSILEGALGAGSAREFDAPFTISALVKLDGHKSYNTIFGNGGTTSVSRGITLWTNNAGALGLFIYNETGNLSTLSSGTVSLNEWHLITVTHDNETVTLYIDEQEQSSWPFSGYAPNDNTPNPKIGSYWSGAIWNFNGSIDQVKIYNRTLSASEVAMK